MSRFRSIGRRLSELMGTDVLSENFMRFSGMQALFMFATTLSSVFIGTFLFKENASLLTVGLFYFFAFFFEMFSCFAVTAASGRLSGTTLSRIGLVLYVFSYLLLLILQGDSVKYYPVIAFFTAFGASFYWIPYHRYSITYTTTQNRQKGLGFVGYTSNFIMLLAPLISGFIISELYGLTGYTVVFIVSVVTFICAALTSRKLPAMPSGKPVNMLPRYIKEHIREKPVYMNLIGSAFYGLRDGIYTYYLNILLFSITSSELIIGFNTSGRALFAVIAMYLVGKIRSQRMRVIVLIVCSAVFPLLSSSLLIWCTAVTIVVVNVIDFGVLTAYNNSINMLTYEVATHVARDGQEKLMEVHALRNVALDIGRIIGIAAFLFIPVKGDSLLMLLAINLISIFSGLFYRLSSRFSPEKEW